MLSDLSWLETAEIRNWSEARKLLAQIAIERPLRPREFQRERVRTLLASVDHPQNKLRVVHVAGTSGKGSTAHLISHALHALGFRVGLHTSPHMFDVRERIQIDHLPVSQEKFAEAMSILLPAMKSLVTSPFGPPSYVELLMAMSYLVFWRENVDYAMIETGVGGMNDGTNVVDRADKICVLTPVGIDHVDQLGKTREQIAGHKAGIIQPQNRVFSAWQHPVTRRVIEERCRIQESKLSYVRLGKQFRKVKVTPHGTRFDFLGAHSIREMEIGLVGRHQAENASLALSVVEEICEREKRRFDEVAICARWKMLHIPGRFDVRTINHRSVVFDVAHNPQKMRSLLRTLNDVWPGQKPSFFVAFGKDADQRNMLHLLVKHAMRIMLTDFRVEDVDYAFRFSDPFEAQRLLTAQGFSASQVVLDDPLAAFHAACDSHDGPIVITGYLHFVAAMERKLVEGRHDDG